VGRSAVLGAFLLGLVSRVASADAPKPMTYLPATSASYRKLADETETALRRDVLGVCFPRALDGFPPPSFAPS